MAVYQSPFISNLHLHLHLHLSLSLSDGFLTLTRIDVIVRVCRILERVKDKMKDLDLNCEKIIFTGGSGKFGKVFKKVASSPN